MQGRQGDGLAIVAAGAPDKRYAHPCSGCASDHDAAHVGFRFLQGEASLPDAVRRGCLDANERTLFTDKNGVFIQGDDFIGADGMPLIEAHAESLGSCLTGWLPIFRLDWKIELTIVEHLAP